MAPEFTAQASSIYTWYECKSLLDNAAVSVQGKAVCSSMNGRFSEVHALPLFRALNENIKSEREPSQNRDPAQDCTRSVEHEVEVHPVVRRGRNRPGERDGEAGRTSEATEALRGVEQPAHFPSHAGRDNAGGCNRQRDVYL